MKKSSELDIQKLNNIIKSISNIKQAFDEREIYNANNLKNDDLTQAACTQWITNIQEDKKKLQDDTYNQLVSFNKIKLATARNIASHDYDSLDFTIIYDLCKRLTKQDVYSEISTVIKRLEEVM